MVNSLLAFLLSLTLTAFNIVAYFPFDHVQSNPLDGFMTINSKDLTLSSRSMKLDKSMFPAVLKEGAAAGSKDIKDKNDSSADDSSRPPGPVYNLKRSPYMPREYNKVPVDLTPIKEVECVQTTFMSPFRNPLTFTLNSNIYGRIDKSCKWNFIGTEVCIPMVSCETKALTKPCDKEYLEIVDGVGGEMKVCGGNKEEITNLRASGDLRDLYIRFKVLKDSKDQSDQKLFKCTVVCSKRGEGTQLEKKFEGKINPKCFCGTKPNENRILGGENAQKFEYPWLVALIETNTRQPFCGGSIINNRFIQTAGHCIKGKFTDYRNIQIMVNGHNFDQSPNTNVVSSVGPKVYSIEELERLDKGNGSRRYSIDEIIVHPLYVSENNDFDVALLKIQEDIDLNPKPLSASMETILQQPRAICLPPLGSYLRTFAGKKAIIAGWGLGGVESQGTNPILQKLQVNVYSPKECKDMFAHRVNRRMICAGHREGGKDSCAGDSGGPLVFEDRPKVWVQIGSVSFGEGCGEAEHPGVYFRTTEGVQWIHFISNYHATRIDEGDDVSAAWCLTP